MTSRRDWQLQQLGITQWSLRRHITRAGRDARSGPAADPGAGGDAAAGQPLQQLAVGHRGVAAAGGRPGVHPRF